LSVALLFAVGLLARKRLGGGHADDWF